MKKLKLAILRNEIEDDHVLWISACEERADHIEWDVVDLTRSDWLERLSGMQYDGLLAAPNGWTTPFKTLYDERLTILHEELGYPIYPGLEEVQIYENKKYLSYWLAANGIPHPKTWVFYYREEALDFLKGLRFPIVGKANVGGSGNGVRILKSRSDAQAYVNQTFSGKGAPRSVGPKWRKKGFIKRVIKKLMDREALQTKLNQYKHLRAEVQKDFVVFQEFIPHDFEWRVVRIGDSFFAHKKLLNGEKASGSLLKNYDNPPLDLFDFVKEITDRKDFLSQSVDIFETADGQYLVNEMQCIFGQSDPYQMLVNGEPGRYQWIDGQWVFEAGDFNRHESFLLRLDNFIDILTHEKSWATT